MKSIFILSILTLAFSSYGQELTPAELKKDFRIFKSSIKEIHPGLYWYADSAEIESRFDRVESSIDESMELREFYTRLQLFYASLGCGHSWMSMPWGWRKWMDEGPYRIPVNFFLEPNRIVTFRDLTDSLVIEGGLEVRSINGISSGQLLDSLKQLTPADGFIQTGRIKTLAGNFSRYFQAVFGMDSVFNIILSDGDSMRKVTVKGLANAEANQRHEDRYGHLKKERKPNLYYENMDGTGYLKIQTLDNESIKEGGQNYKRFLKETFSQLNSSNIEKLIIDLRGNSGGEDSYGATLARYLIDEEFAYYDRMEAVTDKFRYNEYSYQRGFNTMAILLRKDKKKPGTFTYNLSSQVKTQKPVKNGFRGEVIVLIDGRTFSAATEVASILHHHKRATFIGEETGGGYYGNNSAMMYGIQLPNSGINYYLPIIRYYIAVDHPPFYGRGVIPDFEKPFLYKNYINGEDPAMEKAMQLLK